MSYITVAIADDNAIFRIGLIETIESFHGFKIVLQEDDCYELLSKLAELPTPPDICLMDIAMPGGYTMLKELKEKFPSVKVVILSRMDNELSIIRTIKIGANGFLLKGCKPEDLKQALQTVYENGSYYNGAIEEHKQSGESILMQLSYRELELLSLSSTELTMKGIADQMGISLKTLDGCKDALYKKLNVSSRIGIVLFALNIGMVANRKF